MYLFWFDHCPSDFIFDILTPSFKYHSHYPHYPGLLILRFQIIVNATFTIGYTSSHPTSWMNQYRNCNTSLSDIKTAIQMYKTEASRLRMWPIFFTRAVLMGSMKYIDHLWCFFFSMCRLHVGSYLNVLLMTCRCYESSPAARSVAARPITGLREVNLKDTDEKKKQAQKQKKKSIFLCFYGELQYVPIRITSRDSMFLWWKLIVYVLFESCVILTLSCKVGYILDEEKIYCILLNTDDFYLYFFLLDNLLYREAVHAYCNIASTLEKAIQMNWNDHLESRFPAHLLPLLEVIGVVRFPDVYK